MSEHQSQLTLLNLVAINVVLVKFSKYNSQSRIRCYASVFTWTVTGDTMGSGQHPLLVDERSSAKYKIIVLFLEPNLPRPVSIGCYFTSHNTTNTGFRATADFCANKIVRVLLKKKRWREWYTTWHHFIYFNDSYVNLREFKDYMYIPLLMSLISHPSNINYLSAFLFITLSIPSTS